MLNLFHMRISYPEKLSILTESNDDGCHLVRPRPIQLEELIRDTR